MTRPSPQIRAKPPAPSRRGFAMAIIVILVLIAGVAIAVLLERHAMQSFGAARRMQEYRDYHVGRGIKEAVTAWTSFASPGPNSIAGALDETGKAFELQVEGGQTVEVFMEEGQGRALAEFAGMSAESARLGADVLRRLRERVGEEIRTMVRRDGPLAVSVNSANPEVLRAVIEAAVDGGPGAANLADDLVRARSIEPISDKKLSEIVANSTVAGDKRVKVLQLLSARPVLWKVVATARGARGDLIRYEGLAVLNRAGSLNSGDRTSAVQHPTSLISWERVD